MRAQISMIKLVMKRVWVGFRNDLFIYKFVGSKFIIILNERNKGRNENYESLPTTYYISHSVPPTKHSTSILFMPFAASWNDRVVRMMLFLLWTGERHYRYRFIEGRSKAICSRFITDFVAHLYCMVRILTSSFTRWGNSLLCPDNKN